MYIYDIYLYIYIYICIYLYIYIYIDRHLPTRTAGPHGPFSMFDLAAERLLDDVANFLAPDQL